MGVGLKSNLIQDQKYSCSLDSRSSRPELVKKCFCFGQKFGDLENGIKFGLETGNGKPGF